MKLPIVLTACLALLLVLAARWFLPGERVTPPDITAPDTRFDYTLTDFAATFHNADDVLELAVSGPRLEHLAEERVGLLTRPRFHVEPEGADWRGQARRGRILREDEELLLEEEVELVHPHHNGEIRIRAQTLHYHRGRRTITSDLPVEFRQGESWIQAGGLVIRLDDNLIELTQHVQGQLHTAVAHPDSPAADNNHGQ